MAGQKLVVWKPTTGNNYFFVINEPTTPTVPLWKPKVVAVSEY